MDCYGSPLCHQFKGVKTCGRFAEESNLTPQPGDPKTEQKGSLSSCSSYSQLSLRSPFPKKSWAVYSLFTSCLPVLPTESPRWPRPWPPCPRPRHGRVRGSHRARRARRCHPCGSRWCPGTSPWPREGVRLACIARHTSVTRWNMVAVL